VDKLPPDRGTTTTSATTVRRVGVILDVCFAVLEVNDWTAVAAHITVDDRGLL
jgi:hypothetical protein